MFRHCFGKIICMATFGISICKTDQREDGDYPVSIRVTQHRKSVYLSTNQYVCPEQLDKNFKLKDTEVQLILLRKIKQCKEIVRDDFGEDVEYYSAKEIRDYLAKKFSNPQLDFVDFSRTYLKKMREDGRESTAAPIEKSLRGFLDFAKREKILFSEITKDYLLKFGEYLKTDRKVIRKDQFGNDHELELKALDDYGVGKYYIDLRSLYYAGMEKYNDEDTGNTPIKRNPFKKLEIAIKEVGSADTENIPIEEVRLIMNMPDHIHKRANFARDIFMLSFMLLGINPVDLYQVDEYKDGRIGYNRQKTKNRRKDKAYISIKVEPEMIPLIEKYKDPTGERVFDFHLRYSCSENFNAGLNKGLKEVQKVCGISTNLTMYVARRSFATISKNDLRLSIDYVAEALNHVDEEHKVTWGYIEKDFSEIDEGNRKMIDFLFDNEEKKDEKEEEK